MSGQYNERITFEHEFYALVGQGDESLLELNNYRIYHTLNGSVENEPMSEYA